MTAAWKNAARPSGAVEGLRHQSADDGLVLQVDDEGPGIPSDRLTLIFDKFHRVQVGDRQRAGTGLGLAICRAFVEAMGGVITAANRSDRSGAVFTVNLPAGLEMPSDPEAEPLR